MISTPQLLMRPQFSGIRGAVGDEMGDLVQTVAEETLTHTDLGTVGHYDFRPVALRDQSSALTMASWKSLVSVKISCL